MSKRSRRTEITTHVASRPGEGTLVDVVLKDLISTSGRTISQLGVNLARAPVPDRRYVADMCTVTYEDRTIRLVFGQKRIGANGSLRSMVVILLTPRSVVEFLNSVDQMSNPSLEEIAEREGFAPEALSTLAEEPEQTVALAANLVLLAISGYESCIDFYQASPFAIRAASQSKKLAVDAVVRVDLRSSLLLGMLAKLRELQSQFPPAYTDGVPK